MTTQKQVYQAVAARGYTDGWTNEQFAARQVAKLQEELGELAEHFSLPPTDMESEISQAAESAREDFSEKWLWVNAGISKRIQTVQIAAELADLQVVLFCLAEALGVDVIAAATEKAQADIGRGVRK